MKKPPLKLGISVLTEIAHVLASYAGVEEYFEIMLQAFGKKLTRYVLSLIESGIVRIYDGHVRDRWEEATNSWIKFLRAIVRRKAHDDSMLVEMCSCIHAGAKALQNDTAAGAFSGIGGIRDAMRDFGVRLEAYEIFVLLADTEKGSSAIVESCFTELLQLFCDNIRREAKLALELSRSIKVVSFTAALQQLSSELPFVIACLFSSLELLRRIVDVWAAEGNGEITPDFKDTFEAYNNTVEASVYIIRFCETSEHFPKLLKWNDLEVA